MKKTILTICFAVVTAISAIAQDYYCDRITRKDGTEIRCRVSEITENEVRYKKYDYLDGPSFSIPKSEILVLNYSNGTSETFFSTPSSYSGKQESKRSGSSVSEKPWYSTCDTYFDTGMAFSVAGFADCPIMHPDTRAGNNYYHAMTWENNISFGPRFNRVFVGVAAGFGLFHYWYEESYMTYTNKTNRTSAYGLIGGDLRVFFASREKNIQPYLQVRPQAAIAAAGTAFVLSGQFGLQIKCSDRCGIVPAIKYEHCAVGNVTNPNSGVDALGFSFGLYFR